MVGVHDSESKVESLQCPSLNYSQQQNDHIGMTLQTWISRERNRYQSHCLWWGSLKLDQECLHSACIAQQEWDPIAIKCLHTARCTSYLEVEGQQTF